MIVGNKNILPSRYTVIWRRIVTVCTLLVMIVGSLSIFNVSNVVASPVVALTTNHLMLNVVDASNSSTIADYKYLINVDNAGNPLQARNDGCSPENPGTRILVIGLQFAQFPGLPLFTPREIRLTLLAA